MIIFVWNPVNNLLFRLKIALFRFFTAQFGAEQLLENMMKKAEYKFEKFSHADFPVYSSVQKGKKLLVIPHFHTAAEVMKVLEGEVTLFIGTVQEVCKKGDIIFIPPSVIHEVISDTDTSAIQGITFEFSLLKFPGMDMALEDLLNNRKIIDYIFRASDGHYSELDMCFGHLTAIYGTYTLSNKMEMLSYLLSMTSCLLRAYGLEQDVAADSSYDRMKPVLDYVENHFQEKIYISRLSGILHTCDDQLIRLFKAVTGRTPVAYIMDLRMEAAMKMLSSSDLPVAEIAYRTGFSNTNYMNRVFKKKIGVTPGAYRKK